MPVISCLLLIAVLTQSDPLASGIEAFRQGRFADARRDLDKAAASRPGDPAARAFLAMTKAASGDCAPAAAEFRSASEPDLARLSGIAAVECYSLTGMQEPLFSLLGTLQARFPSDPDLMYESAKMHRKAWDSVVQELYVKAPSSYRVDQLSGEIFETEGKYTEAAGQYAKAIEKAPHALNLHYRRGRCLLLTSNSADNLTQARAEFDAELKLNPADAIAEYQLGQVLSAQKNQLEAEKHYERAIALRPDFVEGLIALGKLRAQSKQTAESVKLFEKALLLQPHNEAAHYNLMLAYRDSGRAADAVKQKEELDRLQKPPDGEFSEFLKKLGDKAPAR